MSAKIDRVLKAERLLLEGSSTRAVKDALIKLYGLTEAQAGLDIQTVYEAWAKSPPINREALRSKTRELLHEHYRACMEQGDLRTGIRVLDTLCKLDGLFMPQVSEINVRARDIPLTDPDRIRERIALLLTKHPELAASLSAIPAPKDPSKN